MASSLLALLDDVASILDDVAAMTKIATRKTAGVLGDDLALNAKQVTGVKADRELPVVWAVAKGSMWNKVILVPLALAISAIAPWAITPLLMLGGLFLCFEGVEKLYHQFFEAQAVKAEHQELSAAIANEELDMVDFEKNKIKGAIRTDFVLSAEIIVISLGTVAASAFSVQLATLVAISAIMTVGVYGLVAGIVKLDDAGLYLSTVQGGGKAVQRGVGRAILWFAPVLMKTLSVVGTAAMFIVGGGILTHGVHWIAEKIASTAAVVAQVPGVGDIIASFTKMSLDALVGLIAGAAVLAIFKLLKRIKGGDSSASTAH